MGRISGGVGEEEEEEAAAHTGADPGHSPGGHGGGFALILNPTRRREFKPECRENVG